MTIDIEYNRNDKRYEWISPDGELLTRPAKQKHDLFIEAVTIINPTLAQTARDLISEYPEVERVTWRAVELVIDEAVDVFDVPMGYTVAMVRSSDQYGRYAIQDVPLTGLTCQCPHFNGGGAPDGPDGRPHCKHVLAFLFSEPLPLT